MSKNNSVVPQARAALDQFKPEAAREVGINIKQGYKGILQLRVQVLQAIGWLIINVPY